MARLAHLDLDEAEIEGMVRDMGAILEYVDRLQTEGTPEAGETAPPPQMSPLRPDTVVPGLEAGEATRRAPGARGDLFRVPPAFGGDA
jgi:aspartyl/glutamyl-tRNA(Asn/Gln) amidotransferase C subunit